jgi:malonate decarboxylase beta subunit
MNALETMRSLAASWYESSARQRIMDLLDPDSFVEFLGPEQREMSPHLPLFDLPQAFDDGMIVGRGCLAERSVFVAAQEGRFMGGTFGEVHGAKLVGLLRGVMQKAHAGPQIVLILFDTGGVRLQEANAGELAISEIMRAILAARAAGVSVLGLIGGRSGCFGGGGLIAGCCGGLVVSEQGRIGVTGPEVIETNKGVEEFDSRDRALVWRTVGGKHRRLLGGADAFVEDKAESFREAVLQFLSSASAFDLATMKAEQKRLTERLARFGSAQDGYDIWTALGVEHPDKIPDLSPNEFASIAHHVKEANHGAR